jgi:hypothetical protein
MSFAGFAEGFFGTLDADISRREQRAENYFDQQMERARTQGVNSLQTRRANRDRIGGVAMQLRNNAQMPEEVVRALVNEGPEALQAAMTIYSQTVQSAVEAGRDPSTAISEEFWNQVYPMANQLAVDTEVPLSQFLDQVAGLYPSNLQATQETGGDPFSAFMSSALGLNAMDRARSRLQSEGVAEGFTAGDLLAMEARPQHTRAFDSTGFGPNLQALASATPEAVRPITLEQRNTIMSDFEDAVEARMGELRMELGVEGGGQDLRTLALPSVATNFVTSLGLTPEQIQQLPFIYNSLPDEVRNALFGEAALQQPEGTMPEEGQAATEQPTDLPTASVPVAPPVLSEETERAAVRNNLPPQVIDGAGTPLTLVRVDAQGRGVYVTPTGQQTPPISSEDARQLVEENEAATQSQSYYPDPALGFATPGFVGVVERTRRAQEMEHAPPGRAISYEQWQGMSRQERVRLGLPTNQLAAQLYFDRLTSGGLLGGR